MNRKKRISSFVAAAVAVGGLLSLTVATDAQAAVVYPVKQTVNIRSGPGTNYSVIGSAAAGSNQTFDCYSTGTSVNGNTIWGHRAAGGYISDYYIKIGGPSLKQIGLPLCGSSSNTGGTATKTYPVKQTVNIRSGPGTNYPVTGSASSGSNQTFDCWATGTSVNGNNIWDHRTAGGYIADYYVAIGGPTLKQVGLPQCGSVPAPPTTSSNSALDQVVSIAKAYQNGTYGTFWYVWGGGHGATPGASQGNCVNQGAACRTAAQAHPVGLDCSGFARLVYSKAYNSDVLGAGGTVDQIKRSGLKKVTSPVPGDLVFFVNASGTPHHVGIYIGNGQMINEFTYGHTIQTNKVSDASGTPVYYQYG